MIVMVTHSENIDGNHSLEFPVVKLAQPLGNCRRCVIRGFIAFRHDLSQLAVAVAFAPREKGAMHSWFQMSGLELEPQKEATI